jgi:hypothetical protein
MVSLDGLLRGERGIGCGLIPVSPLMVVGISRYYGGSNSTARFDWEGADRVAPRLRDIQDMLPNLHPD